MRLARSETGLSLPVKYFNDLSKAVLLLWIVCVIYVVCLSCFPVCSLLPCGHLALVCGVYCEFVSFPIGYLGQVWYLIVSIPDTCCLFYFHKIGPISRLYCDHWKLLSSFLRFVFTKR